LPAAAATRNRQLVEKKFGDKRTWQDMWWSTNDKLRTLEKIKLKYIDELEKSEKALVVLKNNGIPLDLLYREMSRLRKQIQETEKEEIEWKKIKQTLFDHKETYRTKWNSFRDKPRAVTRIIFRYRKLGFFISGVASVIFWIIALIKLLKYRQTVIPGWHFDISMHKNNTSPFLPTNSTISTIFTGEILITLWTQPIIETGRSVQQNIVTDESTDNGLHPTKGTDGKKQWSTILLACVSCCALLILFLVSTLYMYRRVRQTPEQSIMMQLLDLEGGVDERRDKDGDTPPLPTASGTTPTTSDFLSPMTRHIVRHPLGRTVNWGVKEIFDTLRN
ncbi:unnamed protein product, partial [Didymodactylos carnosus]